jgi:hypothetical protein
MLKYAVASAVLMFGFAVSALAAPLNDQPQPQVQNQVQPQAQPQAQPQVQPQSQPYNTESPARIRQEMDRRAPDANATAPVERAPYAGRSAGDAARECANCPPPRNYDSTEVIKNSHDVDHSRVINTESVVEVPSRTRETNKLIVNENETRNVGVIQHNHRIIEKEIRYVRRAPPVYRPAPVHRAPRVQTVLVPIVQQAPCGCPCTCGGGHGGYAQAYTQAYVYATARPAPQPTTQYVLVPVQQSGGYAYGYR